MKKTYLIVQERAFGPGRSDDDQTVYAGEGSFNEWQARLGRQPSASRIYRLRQITVSPDEGFLVVRMAQRNPIHGPLDEPIRETHTSWASIPLDGQVTKLLKHIVEGL